jgi:hypothetical protein
MVTIIKKGTDKKEMEKALSQLKGTKKFDAYKHCGKITLKEDSVAIQRKMRDEWE